MCSESFPKEFEKATEVLPFSKYGLTSVQEFKEAEKDVDQLEWLKKAGLTYEEIKLFKENEAGLINRRKSMQSNVLKDKLHTIYSKINKMVNGVQSSDEEQVQPSTSKGTSEKKNFFDPSIQPQLFYPEGHPMNSIKEMQQSLFGHLKNDDMMPINKRRKVLRNLERKKERIHALENHLEVGTVPNTSQVDRPGSLWDMKEMPRKQPKANQEEQSVIGPKKPTMYSVRDNKIVRLEPVNQDNQDGQDDEYRAIDLVMPVNNAEAELLEGTKMCLEDIKKIERFKDYSPGIPSKTLYLKNIAPSVTLEQVSLLFNQFMLANGGPIDVRLMTGRMRGQAFVAFQTKDIAMQALEETNGTILCGRPVIAEFGRNTNRILDDNR